MKLTWQELIDSNRNHIYLIGYGSLLNYRTHHNKHTDLTPVLAHGFERIYNIAYTPKMIKERLDKFQSYADFSFEDFNLIPNRLNYENNSGALNIIHNNHRKFNGLMFKIYRDEFQSYADRENLYHLEKIEYDFLNPQTGEILNKEKVEAFVVVGMEEHFDIKPPYYLYEKACRNGAYEIGTEFGKIYDKTTFYNGNYVYKYILKQFFPINSLVNVSNIINTVGKFPGEKDILIKYSYKNARVKGYYDSNVELLFDDGNTVFFDMGDLSLI